MGYIRAILLCSIAILLPWGRSTSSISIVLLLFFWFFDTNWKSRWENIKFFKFDLIPILLYFFIHLVGLIYTPSLTEGVNDLIKKLSFLILPIIIASDYQYVIKYQTRIKKTFIFSLLIYFVYGLIQAYFNYLSGNSLAFFYIHLVHFNKMHPSYVSMFLILAIAFIYELANAESKYYYVLLPIFIINILLLTARTEIVILFGLLIMFCLYYFISNKKYLLAFVSVATIILLSITSIMYIPELKTRFSVLLKGEESTQNIVTIKNERNFLWNYAYESIKTHPILGIGTGASPSFYKAKFIENNIKNNNDKLNNSHNQYLQQFLVLGIIGFLICIYLYIYLFHKSLLYKNINLIVLSITIIISSFTECVLETQSGIVYVTFFYSILLIESKINNNKKEVLNSI